MKALKFFTLALISILMISSCSSDPKLAIEVYETAKNGNHLKRVENFSANNTTVNIDIKPEIKYQTITGFGGSFTEASAYLLNQLSLENRNKILNGYFSETGANYTLTRTHINSCDFSLSNYSYAPVAGDTLLTSFSIEEDKDDLIPMIKEAMALSKDGFKIISSPWTAPPWMKDNNDWRGGKLLPEYYDTWARFFSKYFEAYKAEGIDVWACTVENEPLGNNNNWESMHFTPEEMTDFVQNYLGPQLESDGHDVKILGYDQNRDHELEKWVDIMYANEASSMYYDGTAVHWYASTYDWFPESLQYAHKAAPDKYLIQTEACVDSEVPAWKDDAWYWSKEATDWGWDWASEETKYLHPKYVPVFRYARDIIGCLNNWVDGWVDWNMVLDRQGGPNWFENWCVAPVIVDPDADEVYFTPIYYTLSHFSKFIRPGAEVVGIELSNDSLMATAAKNPDGSTAVVVLNQSEEAINYTLKHEGETTKITVSPHAIQTIIINQ